MFFASITVLPHTFPSLKAQPREDSQSFSTLVDDVTTIAYYPSLRKIAVDVGYLSPEFLSTTQFMTAEVRAQGSGASIANQQFSVTDKGGRAIVDLPELDDGVYEVHIRMEGANLDVNRTFVHKNFEWIGNDLGITKNVYAPFEDIEVDGDEVSVVLRTYRMNGFGLWDSVVSEGKDLLSEPISIHLITESGEESSWNFKEGRWIKKAADQVVYEAEAYAPSVRIRTTSTIDYDGAMKVEMELSPGTSSDPIQRLWLEIPMIYREAPLFHYSMAPEIRRNYSGSTPHGGKIVWQSNDRYDPPRYPWDAHGHEWIAEPGSEDGVIWTNRDVRPWRSVWKTGFVPYIWLGGGTRGIAWYGASPRDYKLDSNGTMQRIERDTETLRIQVDLINQPGKLTRRRKLVFGLQASPTKPMPENWRSNVAIPGIDMGVHCAPWGAHECPEKYPNDKDFRVVDELMKVRQTGKLDPAVFERLDRDRSPHFKSMSNWADTTWLAWVLHDAGILQAFALEGDQAARGIIEGALLVPYRYHVDGPKHEVNYVWEEVSREPLYPERVARNIKDAPLPIYFEEHASTIVNEEWVVYQDEWRGMRHHERQEYVKEPTYATNNFAVGRQGFPRSYRDFALWYANEWMKRGVSIYADNVYLHIQEDPMTSEAFVDDEGDLQPAARLWDLRDYHKRMWQLAQEWNERGTPYPIMITHHMTNSHMLPIHTWADALLDLEYPLVGEPEPYSPEYLLAQAAGYQTGNYRHLLSSVQRLSGGEFFSESIDKMNSDVVRAEWGMRMVHEVMRWTFPHESYAVFEPARTFEKALWDFGYGLDECSVVNYWDDDVPVEISNEDVKWLLMKRTDTKQAFIVLQSYSDSDTQVEVSIDTAKLGFTPDDTAYDVEERDKVTISSVNKGLNIKTMLDGRYGTKVFIIGGGE